MDRHDYNTNSPTHDAIAMPLPPTPPSQLLLLELFLLELFDDDRRLLVEDKMLAGRDRTKELIREGKRIRRAEKNGVFPVDGNSADEDDNVAEASLEVDGEFGDLFGDSVAGEDSNEVGDGGGIEENDEDDPDSDAMEEFWVNKACGRGAG